MKHRQRHFLLILVLPVSILLVLSAGCTTVKTPDEVARQFWDGIVGQNESTIRQYATEDSRAGIDLSHSRWRGAVVTFGEIRIKDDDATIETRVVMPDQTASSPIQLRTVLRREHDQWKVDYEKTMKTWPVRNALSDLLQELGHFNRQLTGDVDQALSGLKKNLPEIQKEFEALGDSVGKALEETLKQGIPELQKGIEAFTKSFERALEEANKRNQREKQEPRDGAKTL